MGVVERDGEDREMAQELVDREEIRQREREGKGKMWHQHVFVEWHKHTSFNNEVSSTLLKADFPIEDYLTSPESVISMPSKILMSIVSMSSH